MEFIPEQGVHDHLVGEGVRVEVSVAGTLRYEINFRTPLAYSKP